MRSSVDIAVEIPDDATYRKTIAEMGGTPAEPMRKNSLVARRWTADGAARSSGPSTTSGGVERRASTQPAIASSGTRLKNASNAIALAVPSAS